MNSSTWRSLISAQIKYYGAFAPSMRRLDHCLICTQVIVYDLIDEDMSGTLSKEELVKACGEDEDVIEFVVKCPLPELQDLLNPKLLDKALSEMDTDDDGSISKDEWTDAVGSGA